MSVRALLVGALFVILLSAINPYNCEYLGGSMLDGCHFPVGALSLLALMALLVNPILRCIRRGLELSTGELVVIWAMCSVIASITGSGLVRYMLPMLVAPFYFATEQNRWAERFLGAIPEWLSPGRSAGAPAVAGYYEGAGSVPWAEWRIPLSAMSIFVIAWFLFLYSLCLLLRKQWSVNERLSYPLVQPILALVDRPSGGSINPLFKRGLFIIGALVSFIVHSVNNLAVFYPGVPTVPLNLGLQRIAWESGWNVSLSARVDFFMIGLAYFLPLQISFSFWFFYVFYELLVVFLGWLGYIPPRRVGILPDFMYYHQFGAYLAVVGGLIYVMRDHLGSVVKSAFGGTEDEKTESHIILGGLVGGFAILMLWSRVAGESFAFAATFLIITLILFLGLSRLVVQGGLFWVQNGLFPGQIVEAFGAARLFSPQSWTLFTVKEEILLHDPRQFLMPYVLNNFHLGERRAMPLGKMTLSMVIALALALPVSYYASLKTAYKYGASNLESYGTMDTPRNALNRLKARLDREQTNTFPKINIGAGAIIAGALFFLSSRLYWWFLHPIGLLMITAPAMMHMWFSLMLCFFVKSLILKFAGSGGFERFKALFMGLILGTALTAGLWVAVGLMTGRPTPPILI